MHKSCPICNYEDYYDDCSLEDSIGIVEEMPIVLIADTCIRCVTVMG